MDLSALEHLNPPNSIALAWGFGMVAVKGYEAQATRLNMAKFYYRSVIPLYFVDITLAIQYDAQQ